MSIRDEANQFLLRAKILQSMVEIRSEAGISDEYLIRVVKELIQELED